MIRFCLFIKKGTLISFISELFLENMSKQEEQCTENESEDKLQRALALNLQMQQELLKYRQFIQSALETVQETYKTNEHLLRSMMEPKDQGVGVKGAYLKGGTFYLKGNMFFKDLKCRNCPNNSDYVYRSKVENELFPMDLDLCSRHVWTIKDKKCVVDGIKEQVVQHLERMKINCSKKLCSEKLVTLLSYITDSEFQIDWEQISIYNLRGRHTATSCEAIWNVYLKPDLNRAAWTLEESKLLAETAKAYNYQNWAAVASKLDRRSEFQCFVHFQSRVCYMLPERWSKWSKHDDKRLMDIVSKNTFNNVVHWNNVMAHFPHKSKTTIQARYAYTLNPHVSHAPFTPEEDLLLLAAVKEYGTKFSCFPKTIFPHRSVPQLRSRYKNTIVHRSKMQPWSVEDDKKLMDFVSKFGTSSWLKCQNILNNHTRTSCRTRYLTIQKFFEKHPNAKIEDIPRKKSYTPSHDITPENWTEKLAEFQENPQIDFQQNKKCKRKCKEKETMDNNEMIVPAKKLKINSKMMVHVKKLKTDTHEECLMQETNNTRRRNSSGKEVIETCRKNPIYVKRLRNIGLQYYEFSKYSYNYQLGDDPIRKIPANNTFLKLLGHLLEFNVAKDIRFDLNITNVVKQKYQTLLASDTKNCDTNAITLETITPNWQTALAFRALCILASSSVTHIKNDTIKPCNLHLSKNLNDNNHIKLFRKRLRLLLYTTVLLSRLHPSLLGTHIKDVQQQEISNIDNDAIRNRELFNTLLQKGIPSLSNRVKNVETQISTNKNIKIEMEA